MGNLPQTPLVGREAELATLREAVRASWTGRATTILVRGEAGIGKTRLVSELVADVLAGPSLVLIGVCSSLARSEVPWGPWLDVMRELRRTCGDDALSSVLGGRLPVLELLAPGLAPPPGQPPRAQLYGAMTDLLLGFADARPVLIALEDVHWADDDSLALLQYLTRSTRHGRLAFLVTARTEDRAYEQVRDRLDELERLPDVVRIDLQPLNASEVAVQAEHLTEHSLDRSTMDRIIELSGGVPLFVEELVRDRGRGAGSVTPRPLQQRLLRLSSGGHALVDTLALAVTPPTPALLLRASGLDGAEFDAALEEARAAAVVVSRRGHVEFRHALLRESALEHLPPHGAREAHTRWARALEGHRREGHPFDLEQAVATAHHRLATDELDVTFDACLRAAELARRASALPTRLRMLRETAALWPLVTEPEGRAGRDLSTVLAEAAETARYVYADPGEAVALLRSAREALTDPPPRDRLAWLQLLESSCRVATAEHQSVGDTLARFAAIPRDPPTSEWVRAADQAADVLLRAGRPEEAEEHARNALTVARTLSDPMLEARVKIVLALTQLYLGRGTVAQQLALEAARAADQSQDLVALQDALNAVTVIRWHQGDIHGAHQSALRMVEVLGGEEPGPLPRAWGLQSTNLAESFLDLGDWDEAERILVSVLDRPDMPVAVSGFAERLMRHLTTWRRGHAAPYSECGLPDATLEDLSLEDLVSSRYTAADEAAHHGDLDGTRKGVSQVLADDRTALMSPAVLPLLEVAARAEADVVRAAEPDSDPASGAWTLERIRHFLTMMPAHNPRDRAYVAHIEAELARRDCLDDATTWSEVVGQWRKTSMPHPLARALLRFADRAAEEGRPGAARAALEEAVAIASRLGAEPLLEAALPTARRLGVRSVRAQHKHGSGGLTSREREILQLITDGASNAAIAKRLVISPKTVAVHVTHILRKLGAPSRGAAVATALRLGITHVEETTPT